MIDPLDLKPGTHFWAKTSDDELVMMMRNEETPPQFTVCGPRECYSSPDEFEVIEVVPVPKGYENMPLVYYSDDKLDYSGFPSMEGRKLDIPDGDEFKWINENNK